MPVSNQIPLNESLATPGATVFPYGFKVLRKSDMLVTVNGEEKLVDVDYTIDGLGSDSGGNITFAVPMIGGELVMRRRNMPLERQTDFQNLGDLRSATLNNDQDAPILMIQQVNADLQKFLSTDPTALAVSSAEAASISEWHANQSKLSAAASAVSASESADAAAESAEDAEYAVSHLQSTVDALIAGQSAGQKVYETWAQLSATTGSAGTGAQVIKDSGTHTDPVTSATVPNEGQYVWNTSPSGWKRLRDDGVATISNRVSTVETSLFGFVVKSTTVVEGYYLNNSNGNAIASANYVYTKFAVPARAVRVTARLLGAGTALACYYSDEEGEDFMSSEYTGGVSAEDVIDYELTIPVGAKVIGITSRLDFPPIIEFEEIVPDISARVYSLEDESQQLDASVGVLSGKMGEVEASIGGFVPSEVDVIEGSYISRTTGAVVALAGYKYAIFPVPPDRRVKVTARVQGAATALAAYYTGNGTGFISSELSGAVTENVNDYLLTIPEGANYIGITSRVGFPLGIKVPGIVPNLVARIEALESEVVGGSADSISLWGDSMISNSTSGIGPEVASAYPNRNVYQQGIGGQDARQVAARMGAWPVSVSISGNSIPTSGTVACTPDVDLLRRSSGTCSCRVMVAGVECRLTFDSSLNGGSGGYYLAPLSYPPSAVTTDASEPMQVLSGMVFGTSVASTVPLATLLSGIVVVRVDRNDSDPTNTVAHVLASNEAIVKQVQRYTHKWVWMGTTNGYADKTTADGGSRPNAAASYAHLSRIAAFNAAASQLYAGHYVDPLANHIANGFGSTYSADGVNFVLLTSSILSDGIHENEAGRAATTELLTAFIASKGW